MKDSDTVLDYGCGTGSVSCQFSSLVKDIHAIDISSKMIAISKEKAALGKIENVYFEQSDIFDKKYSSDSYDVILAFNMLHTVSSPQDVTQRINEILNPDGLFFMKYLTYRLEDLRFSLIRVIEPGISVVKLFTTSQSVPLTLSNI